MPDQPSHKTVLITGHSAPINQALAEMLQDDYAVVHVLPADVFFSSNLVLSYDVVVIDLSNMDRGYAQIVNLMEKLPNIPIIALHTYIEKTFASSLLDAGATAYLPVNTTAEDLKEGVRSALNHQPYMSRFIANGDAKDSTK